MNKIKTYFNAHRISSIIILIIIFFGTYFIYKKVTTPAGVNLYVTTKVTKGTIIAAVAGSGQVSALNQININPTVSGLLTRVYINPGDQVRAGQTLFVIDDTTAQKAVRDAEINLQNANLALQKLQLQNSNTNLNTALSKAYDTGFSSTSSTFLDLPGIMSGLNDMFFKSSITNNGQWNIDWYEAQVSSSDTDTVKPYKQNFIDAYNVALKAYNDNYTAYKNTSRNSDSSAIEALISQTYDDAKLISNAIQAANNYIDFVNTSIQKNNTRTAPAIISTHKNYLNTYTSEINSHLSDLLSQETNISSNKDAFSSTDLNTQSAQITIKQAQNNLADAKTNLSYYYIASPFSGVVASVPVQKGDNVGSGTTLGTIITSEQVANVSLNEVDIAKIQLGQKVTLTFDAVPDLTITGKVAQIDSIGTVSQGVVNYNVKITFDTNDKRIKPGMSVNAEIITNIKQDVLTVPNGAVKNSANGSYVQVFSTPLATPAAGAQGSPSLTPPTQQTVEVGISNDTSTEIISGLNEGDIVVTRTILPSSSNTSSSAPSILGSVTNRGGAAGATSRGATIRGN